MKARWLFAWALLLALTVVGYRFVFDLGFTDTDAWADYGAARHGWIYQLTMPLTDGVGGQNANFFRPVVNLHYKLLRGLFDDAALGWQIWDLGLHLLAVVLLGACVRAAGGRRRTALLAATIAALHPLGVEIVPAVARNIDVLLGVMVLAGALALLRGRWLLASGLGLLALGTKETAIALLPFALWAAWKRGGREGALRLGVPWAIGVPLFLGLRQHVLSGLGGYDESPISLYGFDYLLRAGVLEHAAPGWGGEWSQHWPWGAQLVAGAAVTAVALVGIWRLRDRAPGPLGIALFVAPLLLYGVFAVFNRRVLYVPMMGWAVLVALWIVHDRWLRWPAAASLGLALLHSPLVHPDRDWARSDAVTRSFEALDAEIAALPAGTRVWVLDRCLRIHTDPVRQKWWDDTSQNNCVAQYSLQAWADERAELRLERLTLTRPTAEVPDALVEVDSDGFRVVRDPQGRSSYKNAREAGWEIDKGSDSWHFRLPDHDGDYVVVLGGRTAQLFPVP